jgi:cytidylate kinase
MANLVITIDGPAASGKSTVARELAKKLKASFLDTGAMYRAVTLAAMRNGTDLGDEDELLEIFKKHKFKFEIKGSQMAVSIDGADATEEIRRQEVTANVKYIATNSAMRKRLVEMQRQFAAGEEKIITEGRDQGTVAFPNADIKFFLVADAKERARRRQADLKAAGQEEKLEEILQAIEERDKSDETRAAGPLQPAKDAIKVDTTSMSVEEVVRTLLEHIEQKDAIKNRMLWFRFARWLCKVFCHTFLNIKVYDRENVPRNGAIVLISNHQSYFDPVFCGIPLKRPLYFLARDTLFANKVFGKIIASVNTIPVKRGEADIGAIKTVIRKLKEGYGVCLFPEGTRTRDGKIVSFKPGFGLLCRRGNAAVVPVVIDGAYESWPRHKKMFSPGAKIVISYGKAITSEEVKNMSDTELADNLTATLRQMQNDCRIKQGKKPYNYECSNGKIL